MKIFNMVHFHEYLLFFVSHLTVIIESIFAVILALAIFWLVTNLRGENQEKSSDDLKDIESALRRVLSTMSPTRETASQAAKLIHDDEDTIDSDEIEKALLSEDALSIPFESDTTSVADTNQSAGPPATPPVAEKDLSIAGVNPPSKPQIVSLSDNVAVTNPIPTVSVAEYEKLKAEFEMRMKELEDAKKALSAGPSPAELAAITESHTKVRDLEARLAEYEIIEDDIANLSIYKEENARLKNELEKLQARPSIGTTPEVSIPEVAPPTADTPPLTVKPTKESAVTGENGQQLMEEFEKFMKGTGG